MTDVIWSHKYAVVDLEATGTGSNAKIIQIGIVLIENGQITQQYETDINPYEKLGSHIRQLTGISNSQLAQAPDFAQVAPVIFDLLSDAVFVAHNVQFDANLLSEALFWEGFELRAPRVDTVELAQVFFPTVEKYGLGTLAEALDLPLEQAHTAISDALATAHLLQAIQQKILATPAQTLEQLAALADHFIYESRLVLDELLPFASPILPDGLTQSAGLVLKQASPAVSQEPLVADFASNRERLGLDDRPEQTAFATAVEAGLADEERVHFLQAQAGMGKTYGYLLPLLAKSPQPILVAVPTKILQEQLVSQEGKAISEAFGTNFVSIKSPRHYLDLEAFWQTLQRSDDNRLLNRCKMQLLIWLTETQTGDLGELKQKHVFPNYYDELRHNGQSQPQSVFAQWDFWTLIKEQAAHSQVLVTNHAYFLKHITDDLFANRVLVVDEAQKLLVTAEQLANHQFDLQELAQTFQSKADKSTNLLEKRLWESCSFECRDMQAGLGSRRQEALSARHLEQLLQNLTELADVDMAELTLALETSDHFWLEKTGASTLLRASQSQLLDLSQVLKQDKMFAISAGLSLHKETDLLDLYGFSDAVVHHFPSKQRSNQVVVLPRDLPNVLEFSQDDHAAFLAEQLAHLANYPLPVLVLFTSRSLLEAVSERLEGAGISHLAQYRHGNEHQLKRKFDKEKAPLLLATGQFWEGIDFANHQRLIEVIVRLPFDNPKDSFIKKVNEHLRQQGKQPFYDHALPMMLLKLAQALGRTSRKEEQESLVILLDPRWQTKRYGQQISRFLAQERPVTEVDFANLLDFVNGWVEKKSRNAR